VQFHGHIEDDAEPPEPQYAGSYHFWFTLPHTTDVDVAQFARAHASFALTLQWLEPLLLSCTAGDPRAIGAGTQFPRANMRGTLNAYSGIGSTDACWLVRNMETTFPVGNVFDYFASDAELQGADKATRMSPPHVHDGRRAARMTMLVPGSHTRQRQPVLSCLDVDRSDEMYRSMVQWHTPSPALDGLGALGALGSSPHERALNRTYQAGFKPQAGNDLRFTWCDRFNVRLLSGWVPVPVRTKDGAFVARFYHAKTGEVVKVAPVHVKATHDLVGFEFRLMDNMPRAALLPLMRMFVLAAAASASSASACAKAPFNRSVQDDPHWSALVAAVLAEGRFAPVPQPYLSKIARLLGVPPPRERMNARDALLWVGRALHTAYHAHPWTRMLLKHVYDAPPAPLDTNMRAWSDAFEELLRLDAPGRITDALRRLEGLEGNPDAWTAEALQVLGNDWRYDAPYIRAYLHSKARMD
jgi:hypothetical protein